MAVCKSELGLGLAVHGTGDGGIPSQTEPTMASRSLGHFGETGIPSAGLVGDIGAAEMASLSILGIFKWVRKPFQTEEAGAELGPLSTAVCESKLGLGPAVQALTVASRSLGYFSESRISSAGLVGDTKASLCMSAGVESSTSLSHKSLGGGFTMEVLHLVVKDNFLEPWLPGDSVLDYGESSTQAVEVLSLAVNTTYAELCVV